MLRKPSHDEIMAAIKAAYHETEESSLDDLADYAASDILDLMTTPNKTMLSIK